MLDDMSTKRQRSQYPELWNYSVTRVCYRLGQLGWDAATAHIALEKICGCEIKLSTVSTGITDGKNPVYEKGKAAPLTRLQVSELAQSAGRPDLVLANDTASGLTTSTHEVASSAVPLVPELSVTEGRELLKLHRTRERNQGLVVRKKRSVQLKTGKLICEACDFDFSVTYGPLGEGFAECHHDHPLSLESGDRITRLSELSLVCSNCHRMLHRRPWRSVAEIRQLVQSRRLQ
jgi:HNH endonuclease